MTQSRPWLALLMGLMLASASLADPLSTLADPTRPPGAFRQPAPGQVSAANGGALSDDQTDQANRLPRLQSIQRSGPGEGTSAMLDDQIRQTGERLGAWTVLAIETHSVVLRGTTGIVRLQLMGGHERLKQWRGVSAPAPRKDQP